VTSPTTGSSAGTYTNTAKARSDGNPPVASNEVSITVKAFKVIVITCETTDNTNFTLVQSQVTLDGGSAQTTLARGDNTLCSTGGAVFSPLVATGPTAHLSPYNLSADLLVP
jgi:hypothetical protein